MSVLLFYKSSDEFYEFDDDGEEDYERYNDEDFYT